MMNVEDKIREDLGFLVTTYKFNPGAPTIFFYRGPKEAFYDFTSRLESRLTEDHVTSADIILTQNDALERVQNEPSHTFIRLVNFEEYSDPHSLCKQLIGIAKRIIIGIYVDPSKRWGRENPFSFSNHHDRFVDYAPKEGD